MRPLLALLTVIAVVSDALLQPFYPQYFAQVFGVTDPRHVGLYLAAASATVLAACPLWALLGRRVDVRRLLVGTQLAAGLLSLGCARLGSLGWFWAVSLAMLAFKASYLLLYPYVLATEDKQAHLGTIGLLAFIVYSGRTLAALVSGALLQWGGRWADPRALFLLMACADGLQLLVCLAWLRVATAPAAAPVAPEQRTPTPRGFLPRLGAVMLVIYFSAYLAEPFFSTYWEQLSAERHPAASGLVFALPALAALFGLARGPSATGIVTALLLSTVGLALQAVPVAVLALAARLLYGWGLFQAMVRLDALLFALVTPADYSLEFSKINVFQGLGVLLGALAAGSLAALGGPRLPLLVATAGLGAGLALYCVLFRRDLVSVRHPGAAS